MTMENGIGRRAVGGKRPGFIGIGWGTIFAVLGAIVIAPHSLRASESRPADDDGPASMRGMEFWQGRTIVQIFGHVFALEDKADVATKYYWVLQKAAKGKVVKVRDDRFVVVEFPDDTGWERVSVPAPKTEVKYEFNYDNYGYLESVNSTTVTYEGIRPGPRQWGRVIEDAGGRRLVEFPVECVGLARPRRGERVVRGPDWRAGFADGGSRPVGPPSPGEEDCWGEVLEELDEDWYVKVRWDKTGREGFYRFDWRRYYDVEVPPPDGK